MNTPDPSFAARVFDKIGRAVDGLVAIPAPRYAAQRMQARALFQWGTAYTGSSFARRSMREWFTTPGTGDTELVQTLQILRDRSRDLERNNPIATGAISGVVSNVIGSGLTLQSRPDTKTLQKVSQLTTDEAVDEWHDTVEREFALWADSADCDLTRTNNFYELQALAFRNVLRDGDTFAALPMSKLLPGAVYATRIQLIEADRVMNPWGQVLDGGKLENGNQCWFGVETDTFGAPVAYHVRRRHPYSPAALGDTSEDRIPAFGADTGRRTVLHMFERRRCGQNRGVPYLAPVIEALKQLDRYVEAELMAAVVSAMFTVFVKTETGEGLMPSPVNVPRIDQQNELAMGNGAVVDLAAGEDVTFANPARPNAQFENFFQAIVRQIGVALEVPYEVLIKHFTASYSAARGALMEAWKFYRGRRDFVATRFCQPVFEAWFEEAVALGRIKAPGFFSNPALRAAYMQCEWVGNSPPQIDPEKEVNASKTRIEIGVSTLQDETMLLTGKVWEDQHKQQVHEMQVRKADGLIPDVGAALLEPRAGEPGSEQKPGGGSALPATPAPAPGTPAAVPAKKAPARVAEAAGDLEMVEVGDSDIEKPEVN